MMDRIIVSISLLALAGFTGIIVGFVREPDLTIAIVMMVLFAFHDFWISVLRPGATVPGARDDNKERRN